MNDQTAPMPQGEHGIEAEDLSSDEEREKRIAFTKGRQGIKVGGSDVGRILTGEADKVFYEKMRPTDDDPLNTDFLRGRELEPVCARLYSQATGRRVEEVGQLVDPDEPSFTVNIDRRIHDAAGPWVEAGPGVGEFKAPRQFKYRQLIVDGIRDRSIMQVQWGCGITRLGWGAYAALNLESTPPMFTFDMLADDEMIILLRVKMTKFVDEHLVPRIPPNPDEWLLGADIRASLARVNMKGPTLNVATHAQILTEATQYCELREIRKESEARMKDSRAELEMFIDSQDFTEFTIGPYKVSWNYGKPRITLNRDMLQKARPLDWDAFLNWAERHTDYSADELEQHALTLELNLEAFCAAGNPSRMFRVHRSKGSDG